MKINLHPYLILPIVTALMLIFIAVIYVPVFKYSSDIYTIRATTKIKHLYINGEDISAHHNIFQCEESYLNNWKTENSNSFHSNKNTLYTYSKLYLFDVYKIFDFSPSNFTVLIEKTYTKTGFDYNNQILVDIYHTNYSYTNNSFTFYGGIGHYKTNWSLKISIIDSNNPVSIEIPKTSNPTELQFNINGQSDRDFRYHQKGDIEIVKFLVEINA